MSFIVWFNQKFLAKSRYLCPECGKRTFSFSDKLSSKKQFPRKCRVCGHYFYARSWMLSAIYGATVYLLFFGSLWLCLLQFSFWPAAAFLIIWLALFIFSVHFRQLKENRKRGRSDE